MEICNRCQQPVQPHDHAVGPVRPGSRRKRRTGQPGLHVRRFMCACGCKRVQFFTVMNASLMASSWPLERVNPLPLSDYPVFKHDYNVYD